MLLWLCGPNIVVAVSFSLVWNRAIAFCKWSGSLSMGLNVQWGCFGGKSLAPNVAICSCPRQREQWFILVHLVRAKKHGSIQHWPALNFLSVGKTGMSVACLQHQTSVLADVMAHRAVRSINQSCTANCIHFDSRLEFVLQLIWTSEEKGKRLVSAVLSKGTGSFCSQHLWVWFIFGNLSCWGTSIEIVTIYSPVE